MNLHDTCGVNNLHGMPAILAAVVSIVVCAATHNDPFEVDEQGLLSRNIYICLNICLKCV